MIKNNRGVRTINVPKKSAITFVIPGLRNARWQLLVNEHWTNTDNYDSQFEIVGVYEKNEREYAMDREHKFRKFNT